MRKDGSKNNGCVRWVTLLPGCLYVFSERYPPGCGKGLGTMLLLVMQVLKGFTPVELLKMSL